MPIVMEKHIVFTLQDIQGLAFQCEKCKAKLYIVKDFDGLKFSIAESKVQRCPACGQSWVESKDGQAVAQKDFEHADKLLDALHYFRQRASDNIPWRILLELSDDTD